LVPKLTAFIKRSNESIIRLFTKLVWLVYFITEENYLQYIYLHFPLAFSWRTVGDTLEYPVWVERFISLPS
jgi:hypothetical protein